MKKIISLLVSLTLILSIVPMTVMADGTGWDGTTATACTKGDGLSADSAYEISTPAELAWARDQINAGTAASAYFKLTADIDLNNKEWVPIGTANKPFTGKFYGNGYVVKNIKITAAYDLTGFFGCADTPSTITGLGIDNLNIATNPIADGKVVGGFAGRLWGTVTSCYVKNSSIRNINTGSFPRGTVGGFIGIIRTTSTVTDCYVYNVEVGGPNRVTVGGFIASFMNASDSTKVTNCYAAKVTVTASGTSGTGPIYGFAPRGTSNSTSAVNCWSTLVGGDGVYSDYIADSAMGAEGATKEGIITALVTAGGNYIIDEAVNDGYPCLDYEKTELVAATSFAGGDGESADTAYQIATAEQLARMRDMVNNGSGSTLYYELTADIDLDNKDWTPIGYGTSHLATTLFKGTFDGNGHKVSNVNITTATEGGTGFFGTVYGATVKNLGIENINITVSTGNIGGMVGRAIGTFTNCYVKNSTICNTTTTTGSEYSTGVGGFVGYAWGAVDATNCYAYNIDITAPPRGKLGGFTGRDEGSGDNGVYTNCYAADITEVQADGVKTPVRYGFAQKMSTTDGTSAVNCFSTLASGAGTHGESGSRAYNSDLELGTPSASKDDIVKYIVTEDDDTQYKVVEAINGGYPSLSWETAPIVVVPNPYVIAAVNTNGMVKVSILENNAVSGASVYVASYDVNGRLLGADVLPATVGTQTTAVDATGATTIKVFVWDPNQTPLANMYSK